MAALTIRGFRFLLSAAALYFAAMLLLCHIRPRDRPLVFSTGNYYNWPGGDTWERFHEYDPSVRQDAVIIGSSHAYRGYDPAIFTERGYNVFNLGSSAQTPLNTFHLIDAFLDSTTAPLLIMDVYEGPLMNNGLESTADLTQNQPSHRAALGMVWALRDLRGLNMLALRLLNDRRTPYYTSPDYQGLGFAPMHDSAGTVAKDPSKAPAVSPRQQEFLRKCVEACRRKGIRIVFASHYARRNMRGPYHEALARYMDSTLTGTGVPYIDLTNAPGIDDRNWFADHNHLNATGARIFTRQLVDSLEALGYLPRRPAPAGTRQ